MNIIELACEAGFECARDGHIFANDPDGVCDEELKRFAALVRAAALDEAAEYLKSVHQTRLVKFADAIQQLKGTE